MTPCVVTTRLLCPWDSPGKNTGVGCYAQPGHLPNPGTEPRSPALQADSLPSEPPGKTKVVLIERKLIICLFFTFFRKKELSYWALTNRICKLFFLSFLLLEICMKVVK